MGAATGLYDRLMTYVVDPAILVIFSAGLVYFMWGLVVFMWGLGEGKRSEGINHMLWGVAGMVIMVSVWGIISMIDNTFGLSPANTDASQINNVNLPSNFF